MTTPTHAGHPVDELADRLAWTLRRECRDRGHGPFVRLSDFLNAAACATCGLLLDLRAK
jgi:hypothetical protein